VTDPRDRALTDIRDVVVRHGWAIRHVLADTATENAAFSYTVGLTSRGWPELIVTGLPSTVADMFIRNAVDVQVEKGPFRSGDRTDVLTEAGDVVFLSADDVSGMTATTEIVRTFTALQLVWPDSAGHLPWEGDYRNSRTSQPLLGAASS
jgi:hypothetical protein